MDPFMDDSKEKILLKCSLGYISIRREQCQCSIKFKFADPRVIKHS